MNAGRAQFTEAATFFAGYFRKVREEMNAGRVQFTEAEPNLPGTSVKSEEKSVSDSAVYGSRNTFAGYFRKT